MDMADFVDSMPSHVFAIDRVPFASRADMVEVIAYHLKNGAIVQIEDSSRPRRMRLCYEFGRVKAPSSSSTLTVDRSASSPASRLWSLMPRL